MTTAPQIIEADKPLSQLALGQLSHAANDAHSGAQRLGLDMIACAIRAGAALIEAKTRLKHGEWLPWIEENFDGSQETAKRYMRACRFQDQLPSKRSPETDLGGLKGFLKLLSSGGGADANLRADTSGGGDEWYTPAEYIDGVREALGEIDLDPASCGPAQEVVRASKFWTKEDDALSREWAGRVFLNPPYSMPLIERFVEKAIAEKAAKRVSAAILLTNNCTDTGWFHALLSVAPVCLTEGRVQFWKPNQDKFATRQGQAFFYLGKDRDLFAKVFARFGKVLTLA